MASVPNIFVNGRMDSDTNYTLVDNKGYVYALNLRPSGYGEDGTMHAIKGSKLISNHSESGTMTVIGMFDGSNNKLYTFLARKDGLSKIVETDVIANAERVVIQDKDYLRFDLLRWRDNVERPEKKYLLSIDQIADLLFISSEEWEYPRVINLKRDYTLGFSEEDIVLAKKPPKDAPRIIEWQDNEYENNDNDTFISFAYRYKYLDGDYSALSFYSTTAFKPKGHGLDNAFAVDSQRLNKAMVNKYDTVKLLVESGGKNVTEVEVYAREHKNNTAYLIYSANKKQSGIADDSSITDITYKFSKNYQVLDEDTVKMLYSNVPKYPKSQTAVGNRMVYANYKEGTDLKNALGNPSNIDYVLSNKQTTYYADHKRNTAISMFKYKVGVVFFNDYNESTTVLLPTDQTKSEIEIGFADRFKNNNITVEYTGDIPQGFTKMKFAVNSQDLNYEILYITYARKIGNKVYLLLAADNVNRLKKGDIITRIDNVISKINDYNILEVKQYDIDEGLPLKGTYAYFEIDDASEFNLTSNGSTITKEHHQTEKQIDAVEGSTNINRYDATSGYQGYGMSGVFYSSKWNRGTLFINDYSEIKEGDIFSLSIELSYGRDKKGAGTDSTDWYGNVFIEEEIFSTSNYANIYEFLVNNLENAYLKVEKNGNEVWLMTNSFFPDLVRNKVPGIWGWAVNKGNREERAVVSVRTKTKLERGITPIIFRTENKESLNEFYFETERTYHIVNGEVTADSYNNGNPVFNIGFYNGYSWGNGVESYKIKDGFNQKELSYKFRGSLYDKKGYKQIHRKNDLTYSGLYNHELGINNLSIFNPSLANWKTMPIHHGEIQRIISTDGDITVFCLDKVINQYYGKSVLADLQGNENVAISNEVLGGYQELPYTFGTQHPESIVKSVDGIYFVDKKRTRYLFKTDRQIFELNPEGSGHHYTGVNEIKKNNSFLSYYNNSHGEVVFGLGHNASIVFNPQAKGFSHYYDFSFDYSVNMEGKTYTAYKGKVYEDEVADCYNVFAGGQNKEGVLKYVVNPEMGIDKIYKAIKLQSNTAWDVAIKTNLTATQFTSEAFTQKESYFYSEIYRDNSTLQNSQGIGVIESINGNELTFGYKIGIDVAVGDTLTKENAIHESEITNIQGKVITVSDGSVFSVGDYVLARKQTDGYYSPDGAVQRGKYMEVTLTNYGNEPYYITSAHTEIIKSNL